MHPGQRSMLAVAVTGLAILVAGCGGSQTQLSGKVTYKGEPVTGGSINLVPTAGGAGSVPANITREGTYAVAPVPPGTYTVTVETESIKHAGGLTVKGGPGGEAQAKAMVQKQGYPTGQMDKSKMPVYVAIPAKYADAKKSGLTVEVKAGRNEKNLVLD